eukprot:NODE_4655_length_1864_cov_18.534830.p1 GENE.NODE_4655_length_1864_cov_18.534830~~NODE_4655_length_1864_cov_18.534830.p1  ORF type:complete len:416 (-),score=91.12 NODE_4655_length_1864_cov_18.534830:516-1763(-)
MPPEHSGGTSPRGMWAAHLERRGVELSLWIGGVGLTVMKIIVYWMTGSALVRTTMYESLGDVCSSAIMGVTRAKMSDTGDAHHYPVGKHRIAALGVLVFCAYMCSSMSGVVIGCLQALGGEPADPGTEVPALELRTGLRRMFDDKPRLHVAYGPWPIDDLVEEYAPIPTADAKDSENYISTALLSACVVAKLCLYVFCRKVTGLRGSEVVGALATDHGNDVISNSLVLVTLKLSAIGGRVGDWATRADPLVNLLLASWILWSWLTTALEKVAVLSDTRAAASEVDMQAIIDAARDAIGAAPLEVRSVDVYRAGGGFRTRMELRASCAGDGAETAEETADAEACGAGGATAAVERTATALAALESAVRGTNAHIVSVDVVLRPREADRPLRSAGAGVGVGDSLAWVREYPPRVAEP